MPLFPRPPGPSRSPAALAAVFSGLVMLVAPALAGGDSSGSRTGPGLGPLPASWQGELPDAGGTSRWHLDLAPDGSYQLRQTYLDRPLPNRFDAIGRWQLEPGTNRLVLRRGREAPVLLQPLATGGGLRKLDLQGEPIDSELNDRLQRLPRSAPIDPRLPLQGMVTYLADAAFLRLCATGQSLPVAMERDYLALERAYLEALPADRPGLPLLVSLDGRITSRPSAEPGQPPRSTLVVERFLSLQPGQDCLPLPLRGTTWRLLMLEDAAPTNGSEPPDGPPELVFDREADRVAGRGGCNRLIGGFELEGERLRFGPLAGTRMACAPETMAFEQRYTEALEQVRRWSLEQRRLRLQEASGRTLLLFEASE